MKRTSPIDLAGILIAVCALGLAFCDDNSSGLAPGQPVSGQIKKPGDEVVYQVALKAGTTYGFTLAIESTGDDGFVSATLTLQAVGDGKVLATAAQPLAPELTLTYTAEKALDAYLIVGSDQGAFTYTLTMTETGGGQGGDGGSDAAVAKDTGRDAGNPQGDGGRDVGHKDASDSDAAEEDAGDADGGGDVEVDAGKACTPKTCTSGCCDSLDLCRTGTANDMCGKGGAACVDCTAQGSVCQNKQCNSCNSISCPDGCCDKAGVCQDGTGNAACGTGGSLCSDCAAGGTTCQSKACS